MPPERNKVIALAIAVVVILGVIVVVSFMGAPKVTVSVEQDGQGTVDPSVGDHSFDKDSTITITATPAEGYLLYGVTVNGEEVATDDNKVKVKVTDDTKIHVYFEKYANVSSQSPEAELSVSGPYGSNTAAYVEFTGLVNSDSLMITNTAVQNYGQKASVFDFRLMDDTNFESADVTLSIPGDVSKGTVVFLGNGTQPTGITMTYNEGKDVTAVAFTTAHFSQFLIYDGHVSTAQGLRNIAEMVNTGIADIGYVILDNDIDLRGEEWVPIGKDSAESTDKPYAFSGTFDGKGYRISNITVTTGNKQVGLFGVIENGTVTDVTLMNVNITGGSKVGAVAGETYFDTTISDVNVMGATVRGNHYVGGIVGYMQGTVTKCTFSGTGDAHSTIIAIPNKTGTTYDNGDKVGGIVGYVQNHQMDLAYSVSACQVRYVDITAYRDVGGVIGCIVETEPDYAVAIHGNVLYDVNVLCDQLTNPYGYVEPNANHIVGRVSGEYSVNNNMMSQTLVSVSVAVETDSDMEDMLDNTSDIISISLGSDVTVDVSDSNTKYGGMNTRSLTIDGNGKMMTLSTTYWSRMDLTNPGGTLVLKNLVMDSTQTSGTWNSYDVTFMCDVTMDSVKFQKAMALDNIGGSATLKDVTITEDNDHYAIWVVAGTDVTIDGLTVNASRGIKVSDEYVTNPGLTEIDIEDAKFTTQKKSAILVGSEGGADIEWGNGNDISGVSADKVNAVWVDIDYVAYAEKVTVEGCTKVIEPASK